MVRMRTDLQQGLFTISAEKWSFAALPLHTYECVLSYAAKVIRENIS